MTQYEYLTEDGNRLSDEGLNEFGAEGWRIIHMYKYEWYDNTCWNYTFIRERSQESAA